MQAGDPLEDLFRQRLEGHEEAPPPKAWDAIRKDISPAPKAGGAAAPLRMLWLLVLPALLLVGYLLYYRNQTGNPATDTQLAQQKQPSETHAAGTAAQARENTDGISGNQPETIASATNQPKAGENIEHNNSSAASSAASSNSAAASSAIVTPATTSAAVADDDNNEDKRDGRKSAGQSANSETASSVSVISDQKKKAASGKAVGIAVNAKQNNQPENSKSAKKDTARKPVSGAAKPAVSPAAGSKKSTAKPVLDKTDAQPALALAPAADKTTGKEAKPAKNTSGQVAAEKAREEYLKSVASEAGMSKKEAPNQQRTDDRENAGTETGKAPAAEHKNTGSASGNGAPVSVSSATQQAGTSPDQTTTASNSSADTTATATALAQKDAADSVQAELAWLISKTDTTAATPAEKAEATPDSLNKRLRLAVYLAPRYTFKRFAPETGDEVYISELSNKNKLYPERLGYEAGLILQKPLSAKLKAELGIGLTYLREKAEYNGSSGEADSVAYIQQGQQWLLVPVYAEQQFRWQTSALYATLKPGLVVTPVQGRKSSLSLTGGLLLHLLATGKTETYTNGQRTTSLKAADQHSPLNRLQTGAFAGLRISRTLSPKTELALEPGFSYYFGNWYNSNAPFRMKPHAASLNIILFLR